MAYYDIMKEIIKSHDSQRKWHSFTRWTVAAYNQNSEIRSFPHFGMQLWVWVTFVFSFFLLSASEILVSGLTSQIYEFLFHWVEENILICLLTVLTTPISVIFDTLAGFPCVLDWILPEADQRQAFESK